MDIKKKANHIAHIYKSRNPFEIIRGLNVILVYYPLENVRGFYQYFQRNNIIYLDEILYIIFDYSHKHYTFKQFEV